MRARYFETTGSRHSLFRDIILCGRTERDSRRTPTRGHSGSIARTIENETSTEMERSLSNQRVARRIYLLPLAVSTRAELQELHCFESEPLGDVYVVRTGGGVAAVLYLMHLPRILALEISDLLLDLESVAAEDFGQLLNSSLAFRTVPIASGVPIPEDASLLILA